jgi:hypothetical protein
MDNMDSKDIESSLRNYIPPEVNEQNNPEKKISLNETKESADITETTFRKDDIENSINSLKEKK